MRGTRAELRGALRARARHRPGGRRGGVLGAPWLDARVTADGCVAAISGRAHEPRSAEDASSSPAAHMARAHGAALRARYDGSRHCTMTLLRAPRRLRGGRRMGITSILARLVNIVDRDRETTVEMVVDSGAIYSVVPAPLLRSIGVEPGRSETFWLADGRSVRRRIGHVVFEIDGSEGISRVIFGRPGD